MKNFNRKFDFANISNLNKIENQRFMSVVSENSRKEKSTGLQKKTITQLLDPIDLNSEIIYGLIMVLTFTCTLSAGSEGRQAVDTMLIGAIGCNVAWGLVDAIMYLMSSVTERGQSNLLLKALRKAADPVEARQIISDTLPPSVASVLSDKELDQMHIELNRLPEPPPRTHLKKEDWLGAGSVFLLMMLSTFPVVIPFIFVKYPIIALRISNGIAIVMLFIAGYSLGKVGGEQPWQSGLLMVFIGIALVTFTITLGG